MRLSPLRDPTTPFAGESLRSVVVRALAAGGVPRTWTITRTLGISYAGQTDLAENAHLDVPELARIIKVPLEELEARRRVDVGAGRKSFSGLVTLNAFETRRRRFAPASLAKAPFCRDVWELRAILFCHESFQVLIDRCVCGKLQAWARPNGVDRCDDCGRALRTLAAAMVPDEMRPVIALPSLIASPLPEDRAKAVQMLPEALRGVDRSIIFDMIVRLRCALWDGSGTLNEDLPSLHAASRAVVEWPFGLDGVAPGKGLSPLAWPIIRNQYADLGERTRGDGRSAFPTPIATSPSAARPERGTRRLPASAIPDLTLRAETTAANPLRILMPSTAANRAARRGLVGLEAAATAAGISPGTLKRGWDAGLVQGTERFHGDTLIVGFVQVDVDDFARRYRARMSLPATGTMLGIHPFGVAQLVACRTLPADGDRLPGDGPHVLVDDAERLIARLVAAAADEIDDPVPLHRAMMIVHGRPKPWAPAIEALLAGDVDFRIRLRREDADRTRTRFANTPISLIDVPFAQLPLIAAMRVDVPTGGQELVAGPLTRLEACEILNVTPQTKALAGLHTLPGRHERYDLADVLGVAGSVVGVGEIAFRRAWRPGFGHKLLRELRVPELGPNLWCRATVEGLIACGII